MWVLIAIVVSVLLAYLLYAYGIFNPMTLYKETMPNTTFVYFSWKGPKEDLGTPFGEVQEAKNKYFKLSNHFGIYYSLPEKEVWDCVVGIVVNVGEKSKIDTFLAENPKFKKKQINSVPYIGAELPYVNRLSYYILGLKIPQFISNLQKQNHPVFPGILEVYHCEWSPKRIEFINPLFHHEDFMLFEEE